MLRNPIFNDKKYKSILISNCKKKANYVFSPQNNKASLTWFNAVSQKLNYKKLNGMIPDSIEVSRKKTAFNILIEITLPAEKITIYDTKICIGENEYKESVEVDIERFINYLETRQSPAKKNKSLTNPTNHPLYSISKTENEILDSVEENTEDESYKQTIKKLQAEANNTPKQEILRDGTKNYFPLFGDSETQEKKRKALEKFSLYAIPSKQGKMEQETKQFKK